MQIKTVSNAFYVRETSIASSHRQQLNPDYRDPADDANFGGTRSIGLVFVCRTTGLWLVRRAL